MSEHRPLPIGTVTFVFTDIEGSTLLVQGLGDGYPPLLEAHNRILREAIEANRGIPIKTAGDAFFNRFGSTVNEKTFCASGSSTAWLLTVGPTGGVDPESFVHSKYIVIWACNSISTNLHHWPFVLEARKRAPGSW